MLLVLPGVLARSKTPGWLARDGLLLAAALPPFASLAFHVDSRIFLPALPFVLPFAAVGVLWAAVTLTDARRGLPFSAALVLLVALVLAPWTFQPVLRPDAGALVYREAARWIASTQPRDAVLLDRKPFIAFYSERRWVQIWWREPEGWPGREHVSGGAFRSQVLDGEVMLDELYLNAGL